MKYVITGATGHIGNTIVRYLVNQGEEVKVLVRKIDESIKNMPIEYEVGDIFNLEFLEKNIEPNDIVIHLAGIIDIKNKLSNATYQINYLGTKTILDICINKKVQKFIYFSSVDAIYKTGNGEIIKEPEQLECDNIYSYYGYSKALATSYVLTNQKLYPDIPMIILYPSAVIGENDYKPSYIGKVICDCIDDKMQFGIKGGYDFIDVDDIARFTYHISKNYNLSQSFILSGTHVSVYELYELINKVLNRNKITIHIPLFVAKMAIPFVPYLSKFTLKTLNDQSVYDNSLAKQNGLVITPFSETIKKAVLWQCKNKKNNRN